MTSQSAGDISIEAIAKTGSCSCRTAQILIVMIATMLHGVFLYKAKPLQSANDRSRWCTVWSLLERGTFQIDEIRQRPGWDTIDMVRVDGHFYSTKPPLLTCLVTGITWCVQKVTGWKLFDQTQSVTFAVLLMTNLFPFIVSLAAWIVLLERISDCEWTRLFALTVAAFGTLLSPFLMTLNNHTVAAASTMISLFALERIMHTDRDESGKWPYWLCGLTAAWTATNELPAAFLGTCLFVIAFRYSARNTLFLFLPAAAIPVIALLLTNYAAYGTWKPAYADYGTDKYRFWIDGIPSYWCQPHGVDKNLDPPLTYFMHCTIGHHGVFSLTPIALLSLVGWAFSFRLQDRALKSLSWLGAITTTVVIAFYMTRTSNYNFGGVSCAFRWSLWLTPFWLIALVPVLDAFHKSAAFRGLSLLLAMVSLFSAWQPIDNPWRQPWLFQWMESRGWIDYSDPTPELPKPLWTWFATVPSPSREEPAWIEFSVAQPSTAPRLIRLTARPHADGIPKDSIDIEVRETFGEGVPPRIRVLQIDVAQFNEGVPPAEFLRWSDASVTSSQQQADLAFVRGLPRKVPYESHSRRYLKTPIRREAFDCLHVAAHVAFSETEESPPLTYRCESWLTNDFPFGTAQVEFEIRHPIDNSILFHERWTVHDCSPKPQPFQQPALSPLK